MGDIGQSSSKDTLEDSNKQLWLVKTEFQNYNLPKAQDVTMVNEKTSNVMEVVKMSSEEIMKSTAAVNNQSPEIFITDDNITTTQDCGYGDGPTT